MPRWLSPRLLRVSGWFFLVIGGIGFVGHVLRPDTAGTLELGKYGGWFLDLMSLALGFDVLVIRRRLLAKGDS